MENTNKNCKTSKGEEVSFINNEVYFVLLKC